MLLRIVATLLLFVSAATTAALAELSPEVTKAIVTESIGDLQHKDPGRRAHGAMTLGNLRLDPANRTETERAVPYLLQLMHDPDSEVRQFVAFALGNIRTNAEAVLPALIQGLDDKVLQVRTRMAWAIGQFGPAAEAAVPKLITLLTSQDDEDGRAAVSALHDVGGSVASAVPALAAILRNDPDYMHRDLASRVLKDLGPAAQAATSDLTAALGDKSALVRLDAAAALGLIGQNVAVAYRAVTPLLADDDRDLRWEAIFITRIFGPVAQPAIPTLTHVLSDPDPGLREVAAGSLAKIAGALQAAHQIDAVDALKTAALVAEASHDPRVRSHGPALTDAVQSLEAMRRRDVAWQIERIVRDQPLASAVAVVYCVLIPLCLLLHWLSPVALLRLNEALAPLPKLHLPSWLGDVEVSIAHLILVGFFGYRERELDAWVSRHLSDARRDWERCQLPEQRSLVSVNGGTPSELDLAQLRSAFAAARTRVLIIGESARDRFGVAHRIAEWAMSGKTAERLRPYPMLPVMLGPDFTGEPDGSSDVVTNAVREKLGDDGAAAPSRYLVLHLLRRHRILLVVAELTERARAVLRPRSPDFPASALVVISSRDDSDLLGPHAIVVAVVGPVAAPAA